MKIHFAGPLFPEAERDWIRSTVNKIESFAAQRGTKIEIIFPYYLITQVEIDRLGEHAKVEIFSLQAVFHLREPVLSARLPRL